MQHKWSARMGAAGFIASFATLVLMSAPVAAEPFFIDGLESGDFNASTNGFRWGSPNRTSIVRDDGYVVNNGEPKNLGPFPERQWENAPESSGRHAMRFRYAARESQTEQRFALGGAYNEIWIRYWLRVPINFDMTVNASGGADNNKFFALWQDAYSTKGTGGNIQWNFWRQRENGGAEFSFSTSNDDVNSGHFGKYSNFMTIGDRGRWMQLVLYAKRASTRSSNDGEMGIWRRWENEGKFTLISKVTGVDLQPPTSGAAGWQAGYILGWANSTYVNDTEFLLDGFTVSTQSLLDVGVSPAPSPDVAPPKPPTDVRAE